MKLFRKGQQNMAVVLIAVVAVILIAQQGGLNFGTGGDAGDEEQGDTGFCGVDTTTLTMYTLEEKNPSITNTDQHAVFVNDVLRSSTYTSGTGLTVAPGDSIKLLASDNSSAGTPDSWVPEVFEFSVPGGSQCKGSVDMDFKTKDVSGTPITWTIVNDDGNTNNIGTSSGGSPEAVGVGDVISAEIRAKGVHEDTFGLKWAVCYEYNTTAYDEVEPSIGTLINKPSRLTTASEFAEDCYEMPDSLNSATQTIWNLAIDVDDTANPANGGNISITAIGAADARSDTNELLKNVYEDDNDAAVGLSDSTTTYAVE